jgi:thioesterase domain-containing protein
LFRSSDSAEKARIDPTLGWRRYVSTEIAVFEAPGNHRTMIMEPYVTTLVAQVRQCLVRDKQKPVEVGDS